MCVRVKVPGKFAARGHITQYPFLMLFQQQRKVNFSYGQKIGDFLRFL